MPAAIITIKSACIVFLGGIPGVLQKPGVEGVRTKFDSELTSTVQLWPMK